MGRFFILYPAFILLAVAVSSCGAGDEQGVSEAKAHADAAALAQQNFQKIDVHTHYNVDRDYLSRILRDWNMRAMTINVITKGETERAAWNAKLQLHKAHPNRILLCTSFDASKIDDPNFAENVIVQLKKDIERGASAVKVWKNIGLVYKDNSGGYIQIDDERFQPIWDFLVEQDIPVVAHIGEPRAAWRALNKGGPHYAYYKNHPKYHFYQNDEVPSWETIMAARDRWLENNPDLTVIGAHLGSMAYDVDEIARRLEKYSNFYVDTAERFVDLVYQPSDSVRNFFMQYADRILYGTDTRARIPSSEMSEEELRIDSTYIRKRFKAHWRYLTSSDSMTFRRRTPPFKVGGTQFHFETQTRGLNLPRDVIEKVYFENAIRVLNFSTGKVVEASGI
jgi:predicted TIM-barrel fold metal-dependent hydrolase